MAKLTGLGSSAWATSVPDNAACGVNPCTWWDNIYIRDECLGFMRCADPDNVLVTLVDDGIGAGVGQSVGTVIGDTAGGVVSSAPVFSSFVLLAGIAALTFVVLARR